jgi:hypothetical protein
MARHRRSPLWGGVLLVASLAVFSPRLLAQSSERGRIYVGLSFSYSSLLGADFDGTSTNIMGNLTTGYYDLAASVPKVKPGSGGIATLGIGGESLSIEIGVHYSASPGTILDVTAGNGSSISTKTNSETALLSLRYRFGPTTWTIRPYILGGLNVSFLNVQKAMYEAVPDGLQPGSDTDYIYEWKLVGDIGYVGLGVHIGAGFDLVLGKNLAITGGVLVRSTFYSEQALNPYDTRFVTDAYDTKIASLKGYSLAAAVGLQFWFGHQ